MKEAVFKVQSVSSFTFCANITQVLYIQNLEE